MAISLKKALNIEVIYRDERLTSVSAEKTMIAADLSRKKRKEKIDKVAAAVILQDYLDYEKNQNDKRRENMLNENENENELFDEDSEEFEVLTFSDEETGEDIDFVIIDTAQTEDCAYLLVIAAEDFEDDEPVASIVKEFKDSDGEMVYEMVEDEEEFNKASELFKDNDDFDIV